MIQASKIAEQYIENVAPERQVAFNQLRQTILNHLPSGFEETMSYGMIAYVVPHSIYPDGYHCKPSEPLQYFSIASQKNFIALYHNGLYANETLLQWFVDEYPKHSKIKLDMGKGCVRFKKIEAIPYELIAELVAKLSVDDWIKIYETQIKK